MRRYADLESSEAPERELIYVLYAPRSRPVYDRNVPGMTDTVELELDGDTRALPVILMFSERIRDKAMLWISPPRVERSVLIHELGHVLGLVTNPAHTQRGHPAHCTEAGCVMHQPRLRSLVYNALPALFAARVPSRFCRFCRDDMAAARREWHRRAEREPGFVGELERRRGAWEGSSVLRPRAD